MTIDELNNFFDSKKGEMEFSIENFVLKLRRVGGSYEHFSNAPTNASELPAFYEDAKRRLEKLDGVGKKDLTPPEPVESGEAPPAGDSEPCCGKVIQTEYQPLSEVNNKTWGLKSLADAKLSGPVAPEVQQERLDACSKCQIKDMLGHRMYRVIDGKPYCGIPRLAQWSKVYRDERHWGCGCLLDEKTTYKASGCPFGVWQAVKEESDAGK